MFVHLMENDQTSLWAATSPETPTRLRLTPSSTSPVQQGILPIHKTVQEMMQPPHKQRHNCGDKEYIVCIAETLFMFARE